jgi:hypothetical protein
LKSNLESALGGSAKQITSLKDNYVLIILALPIAILISLIIMVFIRFTASCFIYLLIITIFAVLVAFGVYLIMMPSLQESTAGTPLIADNATRIILAVVFLLLAVLIVVMVCCFRKRLSLASSIV